MAGGTWTIQNKVRPGAYVRVGAQAGTGKSETLRGIATMPIALDFGPEQTVVAINQTTDLTAFGYDLSNPKMLLVREMLKRAATVLLYRIGSGGKATVTEGELAITALYGGTRGNIINVTSKPSVSISKAFEVETYLEGRLIDSQVAKTIEELVSNRLVSFDGSGALTAFSTVLAGGTDTSTTAQDYATYFEKVQLFDFNAMALPVSDTAIKTAGIAFVKRMRDEEGKKCQLILAGQDADHESVINVKNGVVLEDGTVLTADQATAWVAGASAAAGVAQSLTYSKYDGAIDAAPRLMNSEIIESLQKGEFVFIEKRGEAVVEQDINSLHTYSAGKNKSFSKNRVLRVLDDIANYAKKSFEDNFIGKVNNDVDGREMLKADMIAYFDGLQAAGAITGFAAEDIEVLPGEDKDAVLLNVVVQPVDAMEKLYMTVEIV